MIIQGRNRERKKKKRIPDTKLWKTSTLKEVKQMFTKKHEELIYDNMWVGW